MDRPAFFRLAALIADHEQFQSIHGKMKKASVETHLLSTLRFLGLCGNGCSLENLGDFFGIGNGTVKLYIDRTVAALLTLRDDVIHWPDAAARKLLATRIHSVSPFKNCIGFIDGTLFPFEFKPTLNGEDYFSRKSCYALNAQV
jgi:hypothetical protein